MADNFKSSKGVLVWITGLPGAGKTTLATTVYEAIKHEMPSVRMDGDVFREIMGGDLGYSVEDRKKNAFRLARMNKYLVEHGLVVVCATVSLFKEVHEWNRANIQNIIEVFIDVPQDILHARDQKKMYSQGKAGEIQNVYGVDQAYEIPEKPDLVITNDTDENAFISHKTTIVELIKAKLLHNTLTN